MSCQDWPSGVAPGEAGDTGEWEEGERRKDAALVQRLHDAADVPARASAAIALLNRLGSLRASRDRHRDAYAASCADAVHANAHLRAVLDRLYMSGQVSGYWQMVIRIALDAPHGRAA